MLDISSTQVIAVLLFIAGIMPAFLSFLVSFGKWDEARIVPIVGLMIWAFWGVRGLATMHNRFFCIFWFASIVFHMAILFWLIKNLIYQYSMTALPGNFFGGIAILFELIIIFLSTYGLSQDLRR